MDSIVKFNKKKNIPKYIFYTVLSLILLIVVYLTFSLVSYYKENINQKEDALVYVFDAGTKKNNLDIVYGDKNISEQFLSYNVSYGIDVSEWQGSIDWEKVANTGISFAFIRCGFRQTEGSKIMEDGQFRENMEGAIKAGLKVGVYFFGTAKNEEEALEEANFTLDLIKDYNLSYPVVYDIESFDGRLKNVGYSAITDNILTFTETISAHGYETMVYSYKNALQNRLDTGKLDGKLIWLAHYVDETDYTGNYNIWQYTAEGRVDGISTYVDLNISYFDYVENEDDIIPNPNYKKAPDVEFELREEKVRTNKSAIMRNSATDLLPNKLGQIKYGTELLRTGISDKYSRVLYNGRVVYIDNSDLVLTD